MRRHLLVPLLVSLPLVSACGSNNVSAGEYLAYRIAAAEPDFSKECFPDDPTSEHESNLRSGATILIYNAPEHEAEDNLLLDITNVVLVGERTDDTYEFNGETKDVEDVAGDTILDSDHDGTEDSMDTFIDADGDALNDDPSDLNPDPMVDTDGDTLDDRFEDDLVDANNDFEDDRFTYIPSDTKTTAKAVHLVEAEVVGETISGSYSVTTTTTCAGSLCTGFQETKCKVTIEFTGVEVDPESVALPVEGGDS